MPREDISPVTGEQSSYNKNFYQKHIKVSDRKDYVLTLLARPYGIGAQPEYGFLRHQDSGSIFGQVVYDHLLYPGHYRHFDLRPDAGLQQFAGTTYICIAQSGESVISRFSVENYDENTGLFQVSNGFYEEKLPLTSMCWQGIIALLESQEWHLSLQDHHNQSYL